MAIEASGERWFANQATFKEDMPRIWGDWGVNSEIGKLRAVLMRRPGHEIENMERTYAKYRWKAPMDPVKAREEHDRLAQIYRDHGVQVYYVEETGDYPNALFCRDLLLMTPEGAIITRPAIEVRRGEEKYVAQACAKIGVPIIKTINGSATFEGACVLWVDSESVLLGLGNRCNAEGARQVEAELRNMGVKNFCYTQIPYGHAHLDGNMNIADKDVAVIFPWETPHETAVFLLDRGFRLVECQWPEEAEGTGGINFVALEPGKIVMPAGNPRTKDAIEKAGVEVIEVDIDELQKGWGAIHCMTAFLKRDDVK